MQANASRRDLAKAFAFMAAASAAGPALAQSAPAAPANVDAAVKAAHAEFKGLNEGKNADYIPALAKVDPNIFGIALVTTDGKV